MSDIPYYPQELLSRTFGSIHIGATLAAILFGVTNLQAVTYYKKYRNDWWVYKCTVALLWALDALHVALSTQSLYIILINYGSFAGPTFNSTRWSFQLQLVISVFVSVGVQCAAMEMSLGVIFTDLSRGLPFWLWLPRLVPESFLFVTCEKWFIPASAARIDLFRYNPGYSYDTGSFVSERSTFVFFATLALSDFVIAIWMCYYLYQSKAAASFSTMASMLLGLMRLILVSGLATSACSLLVLITYAAARDALFYLAIDFILPKLYINSFLAMLNRRQEHQANKSPIQYEGHLNPPVVRIIQTTENSVEETNINIPLKEMQRVHSSDELDQSKRVLTCEV
ncbi:hypothetical protein ARMSODRAFT_1020231 [Armillaria solidipes]|uniref:DUF6534 domain-containing protein n=1 Tax=Armillaria solidipes TaxID=1076256 RepID=A0A2H3BA10_9AGAR|nr:hypothetical protein ARMSODRAFT_1020231 [Armillaria solidipes]